MQRHRLEEPDASFCPSTVRLGRTSVARTRGSSAAWPRAHMSRYKYACAELDWGGAVRAYGTHMKTRPASNGVIKVSVSGQGRLLEPSRGEETTPTQRCLNMSNDCTCVCGSKWVIRFQRTECEETQTSLRNPPTWREEMKNSSRRRRTRFRRSRSTMRRGGSLQDGRVWTGTCWGSVKKMMSAEMKSECRQRQVVVVWGGVWSQVMQLQVCSARTDPGGTKWENGEVAA